MKSLGQILIEVEKKDSAKYITHEWQVYGYQMAKWMGDTDRVSMYMKLAKTEDRNMLQNAWDFVKESNPRSRPKLFLWKLAELRKEKKEKEADKEKAQKESQISLDV